MVFALTPVQSAFAQTEPGARDIQEAGDVCENPSGEAFNDIANERTETAAECLQDLNIARGYGDNEYRPGQFVNREQMASFISRKLESAVEYPRPDDAPEAAFSDREKIAQVHVNNVDILASLNIVEGFEDGSYRPGEPVTRGQMASFIVREMEEITGEQLTASADYFDDDNGTTHEENINIVAEYGIAEGTGDGFEPHASVTRGQMALFIARNIDALNNEFGITFEPVVDEPAAPATNQTFVATAGGEAVTVQTGEDRTFTFTEIDAATVDLALLPCDNVTVTDGIVSFADVDNDNEADLGTVNFADIQSVDGVVLAGDPDYVNDAVVSGNDLTVVIDSTGEGCYVLAVFDDADDQDDLDLDADNLPTEDFAVGGETTVQTIVALDASPEFAINQFGENHTVTAQLEDADGDVVAIDGEEIRFTRYLEDSSNDTIDEATNAQGEYVGPCGGTAVEVVTVTTNDGVATYTFTQADPNTAADSNDYEFCVDATSVSGAPSTTDTDYVAKIFSDDEAAAAALNLTPETDTNAIGTQHAVTATVTDQFGDPADANVTFELYRQLDETGSYTLVAETTQATGTDGEVTFAYTGPNEEADDVIIACVDNDAAGSGNEGCDATINAATGEVTQDVDELDDSARKYWVATATSADDAAADSCVLAADTTNNIVDVERSTVGDNFRYAYDAGDQFFVDGTPATIETFENNVDEGDRISVVYDTEGVSTFRLRNDTDCTVGLNEVSTD